MKVLSLISGSLISETTASYALHYAKQLGASVCFVYIKKGHDHLNDVMISIENLESMAYSLDVKSEFLTFENLTELKDYVDNRDVDMMFCSTRHKHGILDKSFVQSIIAKNIKVDLSVIKVVKLGNTQSIDNIIMPIRDSKLSVKKFTLMLIFALAYSAKPEIYSIDKLSSKALSNVTPQKIKQRLKEILFGLRHYVKLLRTRHVSFAIKHDFALAEGNNVKAHIANNNYDLAIVGAHHKTSMFNHHPIDILFERPMINTIYFIPHKD